MRGYLLDTNHLSAAIRPVAPIRDHLAEAKRNGFRLGTCWPVLCEIEAGIEQTARPAQYRTTLDRVLKRVRIWPVDRSIARQFGQLHVELARRGRALSHADRVLASLARQLGVIMLTTDRDFEALPDIRTENWLE